MFQVLNPGCNIDPGKDMDKSYTLHKILTCVADLDPTVVNTDTDAHPELHPAGEEGEKPAEGAEAEKKPEPLLKTDSVGTNMSDTPTEPEPTDGKKAPVSMKIPSKKVLTDERS